MTSYDLKQWADESVGHFWSFSRAQLYKEPARLENLGLLTREEEQGGRRRRVYRITAAGRSELTRWLAESSDTSVEIRDIGLLRLYFADLMPAEDVQALIKDQIASHSRKIAEYESIKGELENDPKLKYFSATLEMGLRYESASIEFWEDVKSREQ